MKYILFARENAARNWKRRQKIERKINTGNPGNFGQQKLVWKNPASHYDLTQTCGHKKGFSPTELTWCNDKLGVRDDKLGIR